MLACVLDRALRALGVDARLVSRCGQLDDALFQRWIVEIGNPAFDGVIKAFQALLGFCCPLRQLIGRIPAPRVSFFPAVQMCRQQIFQPLRIE
ncbi:MAG: hypothetical protein AAFV26_04690 [Pseudomonadota bacterium]